VCVCVCVRFEFSGVQSGVIRRAINALIGSIAVRLGHFTWLLTFEIDDNDVK